MSTIDKQRIAVVRSVEALGFTFDGIEWIAPVGRASAGQELKRDDR